MLRIIEEPYKPLFSFVVVISRPDRIDSLFKEINQLKMPSWKDTELIIYYDSTDITPGKLMSKIHYLSLYNNINGIKLFISGKPALPNNSYVIARRQRVIDIWETVKTLLSDTHITFGLEDDIVAPKNSFYKLGEHLVFNDNIGYAEGVAVGRWRKPIIGAWNIKYENGKAIQVESLPYKKKGISQIQGGGLYCFATMTQFIKQHTFVDQAPCLSVDVSYVESVVKRGFEAIIDWSVVCKHITNKGVLIPDDNCVTTKWIKDGDWRENDL